jgi:hypothetical protein
MERSSQSKVLLAGLFGLTVVGALAVFTLGNEPKMRGNVQLFVVPVLLLLSSFVSLGGSKLPKAVLGVAAIGILSGAIARYADIGLSQGAIEISPFAGDALQSGTRIFRDKVRKLWGRQASTLLGVGSVAITSQSDAQALLTKRPTLGGVLWGGERRLNISLRATKPVSLRTLPSDSVAIRYMDEWGVSDLGIITQIPSFGMSQIMNLPTYEFTARILRSLAQLPSALGAVDGAEGFEHDLRIAATIIAAWTSIEHVAVPKLILGNHYLIRAISGSDLQWGDLMCAEASFASARAFLKKRRGSAFMATILNNEAILRAFKSEHVIRARELQDQARGGLVTALKHRENLKEGDPSDGLWEVIVNNSNALRKANWSVTRVESGK